MLFFSWKSNNAIRLEALCSSIFSSFPDSLALAEKTSTPPCSTAVLSNLMRMFLHPVTISVYQIHIMTIKQSRLGPTVRGKVVRPECVMKKNDSVFPLCCQMKLLQEQWRFKQQMFFRNPSAQLTLPASVCKCINKGNLMSWMVSVSSLLTVKVISDWLSQLILILLMTKHERSIVWLHSIPKEIQTN